MRLYVSEIAKAYDTLGRITENPFAEQYELFNLKDILRDALSISLSKNVHANYYGFLWEKSKSRSMSNSQYF